MREALSIAIPALGLAATLVLPGDPRWTRKLRFLDGRSRRRYIAAAFAALLMVAVIAAMSD
jgi:hypothetical protein